MFCRANPVNIIPFVNPLSANPVIINPVCGHINIPATSVATTITNTDHAAIVFPVGRTLNYFFNSGTYINNISVTTGNALGYSLFFIRQ